MRPIDADALKKDLSPDGKPFHPTSLGGLLVKYIDNAQTLDVAPVVFQHDPFVGVYECFRELFPNKPVEIWWGYDLADENGDKVLGVTNFPDDGSMPQIQVDCDQSVNDAIQILAHELSHVATDGTGHDQDFYDAYNAIWKRYHAKMELDTPQEFTVGDEDDEHGAMMDGKGQDNEQQLYHKD